MHGSSTHSYRLYGNGVTIVKVTIFLWRRNVACCKTFGTLKRVIYVIICFHGILYALKLYYDTLFLKKVFILNAMKKYEMVIIYKLMLFVLVRAGFTGYNLSYK